MRPIPPALALLLASTTVGATPPDGDYSNMEEGTVEAFGDAPSCAKTKSDTEALARHLRSMFHDTHVRIRGVGADAAAEVAGVDPREPGTALSPVLRAATAVVGWLETHVAVDGGELWLVAAVKDPEGSLHERMQLVVAVKSGEDVVCADAIEGIAMHAPWKGRASAKKAAPAKSAK
jgi:hypothetical protein